MSKAYTAACKPQRYKKYSNHYVYVFITIWLSYLHVWFSCRTSTQRCGPIWADGTRSRWCTFIEWFRWSRATSASCCTRWVFFIVAVCWPNDGWCKIRKEGFYLLWFVCCLYRTEHNVQDIFLPESDIKQPSFLSIRPKEPQISIIVNIIIV